LRPDRLVVVAGTGTDVGKTWVSCALIGELRRQGRRVAARKPAQSFAAVAAGAAAAPTDADLLAQATGEQPAVVCPRHRWYGVAMAPPMAADVLGEPAFTITDLVGELSWPDRVDVGIVEGVGGVRSPLAADGDGVDLVASLRPHGIVLVADAALGTLNLVRLSVDALGHRPIVVYLNRVDEDNDLHRRNRRWLEERMHLEVVTTPRALAGAVLSL
jgi:dethiobiotin synthetase